MAKNDESRTRRNMFSPKDFEVMKLRCQLILSTPFYNSILMVIDDAVIKSCKFMPLIFLFFFFPDPFTRRLSDFHNFDCSTGWPKSSRPNLVMYIFVIFDNKFYLKPNKNQ